MFGNGTKKKIAGAVYKALPGTEGNLVKNFLNESSDLREMRMLANNTRDQEMKETVAHVDEATCFKDILEALRFFSLTDAVDPTLKGFGNAGVGLALWGASFLSSGASFGYYMHRLRQATLATMKANDIDTDVTNLIAQGIKQLK